MSNYYYFKGEFDIDRDDLKNNSNLNSFRDTILKNVKANNKMNNDILVLVAEINIYNIEFFIRVNSEIHLSDQKIIDEFKSHRFNSIFFSGSRIIELKELSDYSISDLLYIKKIDVEELFNSISSNFEDEDKCFTYKEFKIFFENYIGNNNAIESEIKEDKEYSFMDEDLELGLTEVFDNINDNELSLNNIIGAKEFKYEMQQLTKFKKLNSKLKSSDKKRIFPFHYIFVIEPGMGLSTYLEIFSKKLKKLGLIQTESIIEYNEDISFGFNDNDKRRSGVFIRKEGGAISVDNDYGVIAINITEQLENSDFNFNELMEIMKNERGQVVFVLVISGINKEEIRKLISRINDKINCHHIYFPDYTDKELVEIGKKLLNKYGFELDIKAEKYLIEKINHERNKGAFYNIRTVQKIIEEVRVEKVFSSSDNIIETLNVKDFSKVKEKEKQIHDVWEELDEFIGLDKVKNTVKEIISHANYQKKMSEMGESQKDNCYHMMFLGNPGTGKTTIARILGKMFKEIGVLKYGDTYEVGRDGLVGRYVGHTAPKVRDKIREAMGSVLFIDEAYSLYSESKIDYGNEALEILIKFMEDKRDDIIVIMAGYPDEMEKLLEMNPGLRDRIPYKIDFPDYNAEELTQIFIKIFGENYKLDEGVYEKIHFLFDKACKNKGENFANGRLARNIAERLKVKHSMRICQENLYNKEEMLTVNLQDIEALYNDEDIYKSIDNPQYKRKIGFL